MKQDDIYSNHWMADEGKLLVCGDCVTDDIWLGVHDSIDNWIEVNDEEIVREEGNA